MSNKDKEEVWKQPRILIIGKEFYSLIIYVTLETKAQ